MNPLELRGPEFLLFFMAMALVATIASAVLRSSLRNPTGPDQSDAPLSDPYLVAYLAGGPYQAVAAAVAALAHRGLVNVSMESHVASSQGEVGPHDRPLERAVHRAAKRRTLPELVAETTVETERLRERLCAMGLVFTREHADRMRSWSAGPFFLLAVLGALKIGIGVSRDRPVGFLLILTLAALAVALLLRYLPVQRTSAGERALERLRLRGSSLKASATRNATGLPTYDLSMAVGLFGVGVLATGPLAPVGSLRPPNAGSSGGWSSCGGSSCGGGGGGGGCGGGGGGCGGCGGG